MSTFFLDTNILSSIFHHLSEEQIGEAFVAIIEYANTHERKVFEDPTVDLAYSVMVSMVDNSLEQKKDKRKITSRENGKKGGRPRKQPDKTL